MEFIQRRKWLVGCGAIALLFTATVLAGFVELRSQLLGPEGHYFDSQGVRIHYTDEGTGVPVVLVHGLGMTAHVQWRRSGQIDMFKERYRVITLDNRGHGRSDKPHDPGQYGAEMSEDLARLLDHLQIKKTHVVGYSLGGIITLKFVATHPDRVLSAAVCASGWGGQRPTPENIAFAEAVAQGFERGEIGLVLKRLGGYLQLNFAERLGVRTVLTLSGMSHSLAAVVRGMPGLDVTEEQLRANTVPVLTIIGDKDGLLSDAQALHDHMANHTLVILPGANHGSAVGAVSFLPELEPFMQNSTTKTSP